MSLLQKLEQYNTTLAKHYENLPLLDEVDPNKLLNGLEKVYQINSNSESIKRMVKGVRNTVASNEDIKEFIQNMANKGLLVPPDYVHFLMNCALPIGKSRQGLQLFSLDRVDTSPYCWDYQICTGLIYIGNITDGSDDRPSYFYIVCDPYSEWYGRIVFYVYRWTKCFYSLNDRWSFGDLLVFLTDGHLAKKTFLSRNFCTWMDYVESNNVAHSKHEPEESAPRIGSKKGQQEP
jgi:hypothetical protein